VWLCSNFLRKKVVRGRKGESHGGRRANWYQSAAWRMLIKEAKIDDCFGNWELILEDYFHYVWISWWGGREATSENCMRVNGLLLSLMLKKGIQQRSWLGEEEWGWRILLERKILTGVHGLHHIWCVIYDVMKCVLHQNVSMFQKHHMFLVSTNPTVLFHNLTFLVI
jgi:hypothetical protein